MMVGMRTGKVARIADRVRKELGELTPQERDHAINRVNTLHARLEAFMFGFHGVSTKYLQAYLDWLQGSSRSLTDSAEPTMMGCSPASSAKACIASAAVTASAWHHRTWIIGGKPHDTVHTMYSRNNRQA